MTPEKRNTFRLITSLIKIYDISYKIYDKDIFQISFYIYV